MAGSVAQTLEAIAAADIARSIIDAANEDGFPHEVVGEAASLLKSRTHGAAGLRRSRSLGSGQAFGAGDIETDRDAAALAGRR